jgi:hypothetical protein
MPQTSASPLHDPAVHAVIERARTGRGAFAYVRNPPNGFLSMPLPLKGSTELSIRR